MRGGLPENEVYRPAAGREPIFDAKLHQSGEWVAMVTDNPAYRAEFPVFRFSDTAWLVTLANLAWDRAKILAPCHADPDGSGSGPPSPFGPPPGRAPAPARRLRAMSCPGR